MSIVVSVEQVGPCRQQLTIEVPVTAVAAETDRVVRNLARQVRLPGFRQGKVPAKLILSRYRADVDKEVQERLVPVYWQKAQDEQGLEPLLPPRVEKLTMEPGEPLSFVASVEVRPTIDLRDYRSFELPEERTQPTEQEIGDAIEELRRQHGKWVAVERPAARGDLAVGMLYELGEDGEPAKDQRFAIEIGDDRVWEELSLALTGLPAGRSTELIRSHGEEGHAHQHRYRAELAEVKELELPEVDEEFAARIGKFDDVAALRDAVAAQLEAQKKAVLRQRREQAMIDQLRERHPLVLPERVVERELEHLTSEHLRFLAAQGLDVEHAEIDWERIGRELKPRAERQVHARLLLDAIAKAEEIEVDETRLERVLAALAREQRTTSAALRREIEKAGRFDDLRAQVRRDQAIDHLLGEDVTLQAP